MQAEAGPVGAESEVVGVVTLDEAHHLVPQAGPLAVALMIPAHIDATWRNRKLLRCSAVDPALHGFGVAVGGEVDLVGGAGDVCEVGVGELEVGGGGVFAEAVGLVVPGIGTIVGCWARTQASATWAWVASRRAATPAMTSTRAWLAARASSVNRGRLFRRSPSGKRVVESIVPVRKPLQSGQNGNRAMTRWRR